MTRFERRQVHDHARRAAYNPDEAVEARDNLQAIHPHGIPPELAGLWRQLTDTIERTKET